MCTGRVAVRHCLQREQPRGMSADGRSALTEHHLRDFSGLPTEARVTGVKRHPSESHDSRCIQDTDDLAGEFEGDLFLEGGGGVREAAHL